MPRLPLASAPLTVGSRFAAQAFRAAKWSPTDRNITLLPQFVHVSPLPLAAVETCAALRPAMLRLSDLLTSHELLTQHPVLLEATGQLPGWDPPPELVRGVLVATTYKATCEGYDYDVYEMLGDAFLKYAAAVWLYDHHPSRSEGDLSVRKHKLVSNGTLNRAMRRYGLHNFVHVGRFAHLRWSPPGLSRAAADRLDPKLPGSFTGPRGTARKCEANWHLKLAAGRLPARTGEWGWVLHNVGDTWQKAQKGKVLADVGEALIGCLYEGVGEAAAWKLLYALGVFPRGGGASHVGGDSRDASNARGEREGNHAA